MCLTREEQKQKCKGKRGRWPKASGKKLKDSTGYLITILLGFTEVCVNAFSIASCSNYLQIVFYIKAHLETQIYFFDNRNQSSTSRKRQRQEHRLPIDPVMLGSHILIYLKPRMLVKMFRIIVVWGIRLEGFQNANASQI